MFGYFKELLCEIRKIRMELENISRSATETEKQLRKVSGTNSSGFGYIRNGGKYD